MELNERIEQIKKLKWTEIRDLAEKYGIEKTESESWADKAEEIAVHEDANNTEPVTPPTPPPTVNTQPFPQKPESYFKRMGIPYCELCGEKLLTVNDKPYCPENLEGCERNVQ